MAHMQHTAVVLGWSGVGTYEEGQECDKFAGDMHLRIQFQEIPGPDQVGKAYMRRYSSFAVYLCEMSLYHYKFPHSLSSSRRLEQLLFADSIDIKAVSNSEALNPPAISLAMHDPSTERCVTSSLIHLAQYEPIK